MMIYVIQVVSGIVDQVNHYFEVDNWPIDIVEIDIEIIYQVPNLLFRLSAQHNNFSGQALLINCHFDRYHHNMMRRVVNGQMIMVNGQC